MKIFKFEKKPNGICPVQSDGWFFGYYFYFRSRYEIADIEFYDKKNLDNPIAYYELKQTKPFKAGYLKPNFCKWLIFKGCVMFIFKRKKPNI